jgi:hypothetical protein
MSPMSLFFNGGNPSIPVFGAIGAITAFLVAMWLRPNAAKVRRKRVLAIAQAGLARANQICEAFAQPGTLDIPVILYVNYHQSIIEGIVRDLAKVPADEIGSRDAIAALLSLRQQLRFLVTSIEIFETPIKDSGTIKRLSMLDEAERRRYLAGRQPTLAKTARDHLATIRNGYYALARALN